MTKLNRLKLILIAAAAFLVGIGVYFDGYGDAFAQAVKICLECIGIG